VILARVQHHPSRADLIPPLLEALGSLYTEVVQHSSIPPDPWGGYKQCLSNLPDCSHVLVIQDDALPVPNFAEAVRRIAEKHPSTPVSLFLGGAPASTAVQANRGMLKGRRYQPLLNTSFVPLVACLWPTQVAESFLEWSRSNKTTRADDGNAAKFMRRTKQPFLVTIPSIVEHNDGVPSVKGGRDHKPWAESWRRAHLLAEDAAHYDW
jgi:hypothetical protein